MYNGKYSWFKQYHHGSFPLMFHLKLFCVINLRIIGQKTMYPKIIDYPVQSPSSY